MSLSVPIRLRSLEALVTELHGSPRPLTLTERDLLSEIGAEIVDAIRDAWPRDTGFSAARWSYLISASTTEYSITLENDADYVEFVHPKGDPVPLYESLVPQVVARYREELLDRLRPAIQATEDALEKSARSTGRPGWLSFLDLLQQRVSP